jgi:DNA-binding response OmpR family regulator
MPSGKILIIDDDTAIVESLKVLLSIKGYETETACDGEEGLCKAKDFCPDLVLLDLLLPQQDGFVIFKQLRLSAATQKTPVIVLSSFSERPDLPSGESLGAELTPDMFMPKPVDPIKLLDKIKSLLSAGI